MTKKNNDNMIVVKTVDEQNGVDKVVEPDTVGDSPVEDLKDTEAVESEDFDDTAQSGGGFSLAKLRLPQNYQEIGATTRTITRIPVGKLDKQRFGRVHPDNDMVFSTYLLYLDGESEPYMLDAPLWDLYMEELRPARLYLAIDAQGNLYMVPVKLPREGERPNSWNETLEACLLQAREEWVRIISNRAVGCWETRSPMGKLPEPEWPDLDLEAIFKIAFAGRLIESEDHPVLRQLRGEL